MTSRKIAIILVAFALISAGCASAPKQAFNRAAHSSINTIVILEPAPPKEYEVANLGHAGLSFGLIGGLVAAADISAKTSEFTQLMKTRNFKASDEYRDALVASLEKSGYTVKVQGVARNEQDLLKTYSNLDPEADAYVDSLIKTGYYSAAGATDYVPLFRTHVRMVKRGTNEVVYEEQVAYGYENRADKAVSLAADKKYYFKDFAAIKSGADAALEGMRAGIPLVASRIAQDISR